MLNRSKENGMKTREERRSFVKKNDGIGGRKMCRDL